jgi:hypothetical protein
MGRAASRAGREKKSTDVLSEAGYDRLSVTGDWQLASNKRFGVLMRPSIRAALVAAVLSATTLKRQIVH